MVDELAHVKETRIKQRTESWMNANILEPISLRDKAFLRFKRSKMSQILKKLRNKAFYLVNKSIFLKDKLMENKHGSNLENDEFASK